MAIARNDMINRVLQSMSVISSNQAPRAEDFNVALEAYRSARDQLYNMDLESIYTGTAAYPPLTGADYDDSSETVQDYAAPFVRDYIRGLLAPLFGLDQARRAEFAMAKDAALVELRKQRMEMQLLNPVRARYF